MNLISSFIILSVSEAHREIMKIRIKFKNNNNNITRNFKVKTIIDVGVNTYKNINYMMPFCEPEQKLNIFSDGFVVSTLDGRSQSE